jgi:hypothetical protein
MRLVILYSMIIICLNCSNVVGACTEQTPESEITAFNDKLISYYNQKTKLNKMIIALDESESSDSNDAILQNLKIQKQDLVQQFFQTIFDEEEIVDTYERTRCISPASLKGWRKKLSDLRAELLAR